MPHVVQLSPFHTVASIMPLLAGAVVILAAIRLVILAARPPAQIAQRTAVRGYRHRTVPARSVIFDEDSAAVVTPVTPHAPFRDIVSAPEIPF